MKLNERIGAYIGRYKFKLERVWSYYKYINVMMIFILFIDVVERRFGLHWWYVLVVMVVLYLSKKFMDYDYKNILPNEQSTAFKAHPQLNRILKAVEGITKNSKEKEN